jgi:hypothetical protein
MVTPVSATVPSFVTVSSYATVSPTESYVVVVVDLASERLGIVGARALTSTMAEDWKVS